LSQLEIRPLTPVIGAEVDGVDLREPLPAATLLEIEQALLEHRVLLFRDQDITPEQQLAFGRKALFLNYNTGCQLKGVTHSENDLLRPFLFDHVRSPEFQCRIRWEPNSVAFWDNRCVQHIGVPDYSERRVMHRVTIDGDEPY
jgi:alpha-ketoglutarate-dependent taurine dioxygenase